MLRNLLEICEGSRRVMITVTDRAHPGVVPIPERIHPWEAAGHFLDLGVRLSRDLHPNFFAKFQRHLGRKHHLCRTSAFAFAVVFIGVLLGETRHGHRTIQPDGFRSSRNDWSQLLIGTSEAFQKPKP